ncbi:MAG: CRISPR-associated protein Cas4 [Thermoplasmata archaeon]
MSRFKSMIPSRMNESPTIRDVERYVEGSGVGLGRGRIDATLMLEDNTIVICDLKKKPYKDNLDSKIQIAGYAIALEKAHKISVSVGCLVFTQPTMSGDAAEPYRELFSLDEGLRKEFLKRTRRAVEIISGQALPPIVSTVWKCKKCRYYYYCHHGNRKLKTPGPTE